MDAVSLLNLLVSSSDITKKALMESDVSSAVDR